MNIAYTEQYQKHLHEYDSLFQKQNEISDCSEGQVLSLNDNLFIRTRDFLAKERIGQGIPLERKGFLYEIYDAEDKLHYQWRATDNDGSFVQKISHSDGHEYLLFKQDLYGYSTLNLQTMEVMHYAPHKSFPQNKEDFQETFIWVNPVYDKSSDLLAVEGCIWGAPYSVIVMDFSNPMKMQENWLELHTVLGNGFSELFSEIIFLKWDDNNGLVVEAEREDGGNLEQKCFSVEQLKSILKHEQKVQQYWDKIGVA